MKPPTVFLGEMTNPEVEAFLKTHHTVIIPTGATEQHGPHGPHLAGIGVLGDAIGTWGDARKSTAEIGERYLEAGIRSTLAVLENIENTFAAMPPR